jgi:hypothetical protein
VLIQYLCILFKVLTDDTETGVKMARDIAGKEEGLISGEERPRLDDAEEICWGK